MNAIHLIVFVHGFLGFHTDFNYTATKLQEHFGDNLLIHLSTSNDGFLSNSHGIDVSGISLAKEVREVVNEHPSLKKISFVGKSIF
jgi:hypothetical protein